MVDAEQSLISVHVLVDKQLVVAAPSLNGVKSSGGFIIRRIACACPVLADVTHDHVSVGQS